MTSTITTPAIIATTPDYPASVWDEFDASTDPLTTAAMRAEEHSADVVDALAQLLAVHPELEAVLRPALTSALRAKATAESAWVSARDAELQAIAARQAGPSVSAILGDGSAVTYAGATLSDVDAAGAVHLTSEDGTYRVLAPGTFISITAS